jgi:hypothetical protein
MCDYYSSSFINIAGIASKDGRQGFFFPHGAEHGEDMRAQFCIGGKPYRILHMLHGDSTIEELPLLKRAWYIRKDSWRRLGICSWGELFGMGV